MWNDIKDILNDIKNDIKNKPTFFDSFLELCANFCLFPIVIGLIGVVIYLTASIIFLLGLIIYNIPWIVLIPTPILIITYLIRKY